MPAKTYQYQTTTSAKLSGYLSDSQRSDHTTSVKSLHHPKLRKPKSTKDLKSSRRDDESRPLSANSLEADHTSRWVRQQLNVPPVPSRHAQQQYHERIVSQAPSALSYSSSSTLYNSSPEDLIPRHHKKLDNNNLKLDVSYSGSKPRYSPIHTPKHDFPAHLTPPIPSPSSDHFHSSYNRSPPTAFKVTARTIITPSPRYPPRSPSTPVSPTLNLIPPPAPEPQNRLRSPAQRPRKPISSSGWLSTRPVTISETGSIVSSTPPSQTPKFNIAGTEGDDEERDRRYSGYTGTGDTPISTATDVLGTMLDLNGGAGGTGNSSHMLDSSKSEKGSLSAERRSTVGESMLSAPSMMMNLLRRGSMASSQPESRRSRSKSKSRDPHDTSRPQSIFNSPLVQSPVSPAMSLLPFDMNGEKEKEPPLPQKKKFEFSLPSIAPLRIAKAWSSKAPKSNGIIVSPSKNLPAIPSPAPPPPRSAMRNTNRDAPPVVNIQVTTLGPKEHDVWNAVRHLRSVNLNDEDYAFCQNEDPEVVYDDAFCLSMGIGGFGKEPRRWDIPYDDDEDSDDEMDFDFYMNGHEGGLESLVRAGEQVGYAGAHQRMNRGRV